MTTTASSPTAGSTTRSRGRRVVALENGHGADAIPPGRDGRRSGLDTPIRVLYHSHSTSRESGVTVSTQAHSHRPLSALGALAALLLLVATACGGATKPEPRRGRWKRRGGWNACSSPTRRRARPTRRSSRPIRRPTPARAGTSRSPTPRPASSGGPSRRASADVVHLSLEPDVTALVDAGLVDADWSKNDYRDLDELRGRLRGSARQPGEHPVLGRPPRRRHRGHHAQPVHLRRRPVEHHGRLRRGSRAGQVRRGGDRAPARALPRARAGAGQERA